MTAADPRDTIILSLAEKLYICSRLLTRAAERLGWNTSQVQELVVQLKDAIKGDVNASVKAAR